MQLKAMLPTEDRRRSILIALAAIGFHVFSAGLVVWFAHFPQSLDEIQHLSFLRAMAQAPDLFPRYEAMRTLDPTGLHWTGTVNYLNHPSLYYLFMAQVDGLLHGSILGLRVTDVALSSLGVGLMLAGGFRLLGDWRERAVFALFLVVFPKLGLISGIINNDAAALIATGTAFLGLAGWQARGRLRDGLLLGLGVALAGWTKFTVALMVGFAVVLAEAIRWKDGAKRPTLGAYAMAAAGAAIGLIPSLVNLHRYGRMLFNSPFFYTPPAQREPISLSGYGVLFLHQMVDGWSVTGPTPLLFSFGLYAVLVFGMIVAALALAVRREGPDAAAWRVAGGFVLALIPTLLLHFKFGWTSVVEDGFRDMAQPRYYYGLWPGFALALALLWARAGPGPVRRMTTAATAVLLIASSAAYTILRLYLAGAPAIY